jgi:hypothetical protein
MCQGHEGNEGRVREGAIVTYKVVFGSLVEIVMYVTRIRLVAEINEG